MPAWLRRVELEAEDQYYLGVRELYRALCRIGQRALGAGEWAETGESAPVLCETLLSALGDIGYCFNQPRLYATWFLHRAVTLFDAGYGPDHDPCLVGIAAVPAQHLDQIRTRRFWQWEDRTHVYAKQYVLAEWRRSRIGPPPTAPDQERVSREVCRDVLAALRVGGTLTDQKSGESGSGLES